jgi:predicted phage terminase large subunit-like protein
MTLVDAHHDAIEQDLRRRREGRSLIEEGLELSKSLRTYIRDSWHVIRPDDAFIDNWHIGAMCEQLEEISAGRLRKLMIWVPPGSMKTITVSVAWPTWEWTQHPQLRYMTCSYDMDLAIEQGGIPSRDLILSDWYQDRWGHVFRLKVDQNLKRSYANNRGGARYCAAPGAKKVTGRHVHRMILDDPNDATSAEGISDGELDKVIAWNDGSLPTRFANPKTGAKVVVQQRLHEKDLSGHILEREGSDQDSGSWRVLCLPERFDPKHPFVWPEDARSPDELLWSDRIGEDENEARKVELGAHRASGQLQQEPSAREGEILKRAFWSYFPPEFLELAEEGDTSRLPNFRMMVISVDTSFEEKTSSDPVAVGIWGVLFADKYLLRLDHKRMSLSATKTSIRQAREWAIERWPRTAVYELIEKKSNGVKIIEQMRREIPGITPFNPSRDKTQRAIEAEPDFSSGNVWLPGSSNGAGDDYDPGLTPAWAQDVVEQCAKFPKGSHDDLVDMTTQCINWTRFKSRQSNTVSSPADIMLPTPHGIPAGAPSMLPAR